MASGTWCPGPVDRMFALKPIRNQFESWLFIYRLRDLGPSLSPSGVERVACSFLEEWGWGGEWAQHRACQQLGALYIVSSLCLSCVRPPFG